MRACSGPASCGARLLGQRQIEARGGACASRPPRPIRPAAPARTGAPSPAAGSARRPRPAPTSDLSTRCVSRSRTSRRSIVAAGADRFGGLERPAAGEDRQAPQQRALGLGEQVVAPVDQRAQRLLARQRRADRRRSAGGSDRSGARAISLDRQRRARAPPRARCASGMPSSRRQIVGHRRRVLGRSARTPAGRRIARSTNSRTASYCASVVGASTPRCGSGSGKRRHADRSARRRTRSALAAGGEDAAPAAQRAAAALASSRAGVEQVLAVVEHQQHAARLRCSDKRLHERPAALLLHAEHLRRLAEARAAGRRAARARRATRRRDTRPISFGRDLQRQPRLAAGRPCRAASAAGARRAAALTSSSSSLAPDETRSAAAAGCSGSRLTGIQRSPTCVHPIDLVAVGRRREWRVGLADLE